MKLAEEYINGLKNKYSLLNSENETYQYKETDLAERETPEEIRNTFEYNFIQGPMVGGEFYHKLKMKIKDKVYNYSRYENPMAFKKCCNIDKTDFKITNLSIEFNDNSKVYIVNNTVFFDTGVQK